MRCKRCYFMIIKSKSWIKTKSCTKGNVIIGKNMHRYIRQNLKKQEEKKQSKEYEWGKKSVYYTT